MPLPEPPLLARPILSLLKPDESFAISLPEQGDAFDGHMGASGLPVEERIHQVAEPLHLLAHFTHSLPQALERLRLPLRCQWQLHVSYIPGARQLGGGYVTVRCQLTCWIWNQGQSIMHGMDGMDETAYQSNLI